MSFIYRRELKEMSRAMERQDQQISSMRRVTDRFNLEEEVMGLKWVMMGGRGGEAFIGFFIADTRLTTSGRRPVYKWRSQSVRRQT